MGVITLKEIIKHIIVWVFATFSIAVGISKQQQTTACLQLSCKFWKFISFKTSLTVNCISGISPILLSAKMEEYGQWQILRV